MPYYKNVSNHLIIYKDIIIEPGSVKFIPKSVMYEGLVVSSKPKRRKNRKLHQEVDNTLETKIEKTSDVEDNVSDDVSEKENVFLPIETDLTEINDSLK